MKKSFFKIFPNEEGWHSLAAKKLSALLRRTTSKYVCDFYCFNCVHLFKPKSKLETHKKLRENKDFCGVVMPSEDTTKEFNQRRKSDKTPSIIYADLEYWIKTIDSCKSNFEK